MTTDHQERATHWARSWVVRLALLDGGVGFVAGILLRTWQISVEPGQVIAGLVRYPTWNPEFRYQAGTWTLLNQVSALGLGAGLSESAVSSLLSGIVASIAFAALALIVFGVSRRPALAAAAPLILVYARAGSATPGVTYNVALMFSGGTYGTFGIACVALVLGLLVCEKTGAAGLTAALILAVHPSFGIWLAIILVVVFSVQPVWAIRVARRDWPLWLAGLAVTGASFVAHRVTSQTLPAVPEDDARFFEAFITYWDAHRRPFPLWSSAMAESLLGAAWGVFLMADGRRSNAPGARALGTAMLAAAAIAACFSIVYWMEPGTTPRLLLALMPSRVFNIDIALALPVALGVLASVRAGGDYRLIAAIAILLGSATLSLSGKAIPGLHLPEWTAVDRQWVTAAIGAVALASLVFSRRESAPPGRGLSVGSAPALVRAAVVLVLLALAAAGALLRRPALTDRTNDRFWSTVAARPGTIVNSPGITMVQLRSRRPVLLNPYSLDYLPFTPGTGASIARILKDVYGVDLLQPAEHLRRVRRGGLVPADGRELWETRSPANWTELRRRFGVTDVLAEGHWRIDLPAVARGDGLVLYEIP